MRHIPYSRHTLDARGVRDGKKYDDGMHPGNDSGIQVLSPSDRSSFPGLTR
jgi:hypothetical protein